MKTPIRFTLAIASASLLAIGLAQGLEDQKQQFKIAPEEFHARLLKDDAPLPNGGQMQMSYATVVEKILPSVVTVFAYGGKEEQELDIDQIPPQLRPFFRHFGMPGGEDEESPSPRGNPRLRPRAAPQPQEDARPNGVGSGFIISNDGYIMTNNHVVGDADKIEVVVEINGSTRTHVAKVIGTDPQTDVALIKIEASNLPQATLADSSKLRVGDIVLAAGAPMELSRSVSQGIISALGRSGMGIVGRRDMQGYEDFIQTDASINPGNSGGPLVDALGRVVGINTAILSRSGMNAGIGFAIPVNMAMRIVEDLIDDGKVARGYLGIYPADVDAEIVKLWGLEDESGALVRTVKVNSPAAKAGLQVGDVITKVSGQRVENASKLPLIVSSYKPGTEITLNIVREGKPVVITAKLASLTDPAIAGNDVISEAPSRGGPGGSASIAEIIPGVTVQNLTPATRERYEIPAEVAGVIVTQVDSESRAALRGLKEGDVITKVGKVPVRAVGEARDVAMAKQGTVIFTVYRNGDTELVMVDKN